jgi:amidase
MDYEEYDGLGLAERVRNGETTPRELLERAIARLERFNPALNAVITPMLDQAWDRTREPPGDGPFAGVPFLAKDLMLFFAGAPMSNGSRALRRYVPTEDSSQARAIKEAGFVVFGKTNSSELGAQPLTNPAAFGPTCNPWDLSLNAGGSSGGSTAAVAARIVPLAASSDGGGSIRLPASYCGVFGFKPSRGLNPFESAVAWGGAVVTHATTVSVRDSAAYLDWTSRGVRPDGHRPLPGSFLAATQAPTPRLRIGYSVESPVGGPVDPECVRAVEATAQLLRDLGHQVEPCTVPYDGDKVMRGLLTLVARYTFRDLERMAAWVGTSWRRLEVEESTRFLAEVGSGVTDAQVAAALEAWAEAARQMEAFHGRHTVLLTPVTATPPLPHDAIAPSGGERLAMRVLSGLRLGRFLFGDGLLTQTIQRAIAPLPFTQVANVTGQPAMSVPLHWSPAGLPIGSHFMAAAGNDALLFNLAAQLEKAAPWHDRRPPLVTR